MQPLNTIEGKSKSFLGLKSLDYIDCINTVMFPPLEIKPLRTRIQVTTVHNNFAPALFTIRSIKADMWFLKKYAPKKICYVRDRMSAEECRRMPTNKTEIFSLWVFQVKDCVVLCDTHSDYSCAFRKCSDFVTEEFLSNNASSWSTLVFIFFYKMDGCLFR